MPNKENRPNPDLSTEFLSGLPLFFGMTDEELHRFISAVEGYFCTFHKGEFIGIEGDAILGVGILLTGTVAVLKENAEGERHRIAVLKPGEIFGEVAVYTGDHWTASVLAEEAATVLILPRRNLLDVKALPEISGVFLMNMLKLVSSKALNLNRKLDILSMGSLRQKLVRLLQSEWRTQRKNPLILQMNREEMAEYLKASRPALSRELMKMRKEHLVEYHKNQFYLSERIVHMD